MSKKFEKMSADSTKMSNHFRCMCKHLRKMDVKFMIMY